MVCALTFLDVVLWFAAVPLLPRWERELGLSTDEAGAVVGAYSAAILVASVPVGMLADRIGPRGVTIGASAALVVVGPGLALADGVWELVAVRFAQGLCSATAWSAGLAWVVASTPVGGRARSLALVNTTATAATVAGPLVGGPLVAAVGLGGAMVGLAAAVAVATLVALAAPAGGEVVAADRPRSIRAELALVARARGRLRAALLSIALVATGIGAVQLLAPLHLADVGLDESAIGLVFTVGAALSLIESLLLVRIADRIAGVGPLAAGVGGLAALLAVLALGPGQHLYAALVVIAMMATLPVFVLSYPTCAEGAAEQGVGQGAALGALNMLWAAGALVAPVAAGLIADARGDGAAFGAMALVVGVGAALLARGARRVTAGG